MFYKEVDKMKNIKDVIQFIKRRIAKRKSLKIDYTFNDYSYFIKIKSKYYKNNNRILTEIHKMLGDFNQNAFEQEFYNNKKIKGIFLK